MVKLHKHIKLPVPNMVGQAGETVEGVCYPPPDSDSVFDGTWKVTASNLTPGVMIQFLVWSPDGAETSVTAMPHEDGVCVAAGHIYALGTWNVAVTTSGTPDGTGAENVLCTNTFEAV